MHVFTYFKYLSSVIAKTQCVHKKFWRSTLENEIVCEYEHILEPN
jgi:hypothetical protein